MVGSFRPFVVSHAVSLTLCRHIAQTETALYSHFFSFSRNLIDLKSGLGKRVLFQVYPQREQLCLNPRRHYLRFPMSQSWAKAVGERGPFSSFCTSCRG